MNYDKAMEWADALESGKFPQTIHHLCDNGSYCCLGVACDIGNFSYTESDEGIRIYDGTSVGLSTNVMNYYDISSTEGTPKNGTMIEIDGKSYYRLSDANDHGVPFSKIAKWIRENYQLL